MNITRKQSTNNLPFDPDTVEVVVRDATGLDMENAYRAAGKDASETRLMAAVIAQTATFDGKKLVMEDVLQLPVKLLGELGNALAASSDASETTSA
jgi:hypothetical protein